MINKKAAIILLTGLLMTAVSCSSSRMRNRNGLSDGTQLGHIKAENQKSYNVETEIKEKKAAPDYAKLKVNEAGQIIIVMFHKFVENFTPTANDKGDYTTTFKDFEKLLGILYERGYRLISLKDFLDNYIDVPAGCTPIVFTFDDGSFGQFHLDEGDGELKAADKTAVSVMEKFNREHPDFGLRGVFYLNLGLSTFGNKGTLKEKIFYLTGRGFEIGNHTYSHINLGTAGPDTIQKEITANTGLFYEITGGVSLETLALPYGVKPEKNFSLLEKGRYGQVQYENKAVLLVGASPAVTPADTEFDPMRIPRVRSSGIIPADGDLKWWVKVMDENPVLKYISDGDPETVTIPKEYSGKIIRDRLKSKELVMY